MSGPQHSTFASIFRSGTSACNWHARLAHRAPAQHPSNDRRLILCAGNGVAGHRAVASGRAESASHCQNCSTSGLLNGNRSRREGQVGNLLCPIGVGTTWSAWNRRHRRRGLYVERHVPVLDFSFGNRLRALHGYRCRILPRRLSLAGRIRTGSRGVCGCVQRDYNISLSESGQIPNRFQG